MAVIAAFTIAALTASAAGAWGAEALTADVVNAVVVMAASTPTALPAPLAPCVGKHSAGLEVSVNSPRSGSVVDLARTPSVAVDGRLEGRAARTVTKVDLYGDGTLIRSIALPSRRRSDETSWSTSFTPPFGTHTVVACVSDDHGSSASPTVRFTVKTPAADATLLTADAQPLSAAQLAAVTAVTPTTVMLTGTAPIAVGKVIVAGVGTLTPRGLLRRIASERTRGTTTTYTTTDASLTDVFLQASLEQTAVPFQSVATTSPTITPTTTTTKPASFTGATSAATTTIPGLAPLTPTVHAEAAVLAAPAIVAAPAALAAGTKVTVPLWDLKQKDTQSVTRTAKPNENLKATGTLTLTETMSSKADATLTFKVKISAKWNGWVPTPQLDSFSLTAGGTANSQAKLEGKGSGTITYTAKDFSPPFEFAPMEFTILGVPVVVVPTVSVDFAARADLTVDASFEVKASAAFTTGVAYANGQLAPVNDVTQTVSVVTPLTGGFNANADAKAEFDPKLTFYIDDMAGPDIGAAIGAEMSAAVPTPCRVTGDVYANFSVGARVKVLDKLLLDKSFPVLEGKLPFIDQALPVCSATSAAPTVTTTSLPQATQGSAYSTTLAATGGTPATGTPYTWTETGALPTGITLGVDGTLSGTPTASGSFPITVTASDNAGKTGSASLTLVVAAAGGGGTTGTLAITTTSLPTATAGAAYSATLAATGGTGPYTWAVTGLPAGLTATPGGAISGTTTADQSYPVSITVTDAAGATATTSLTLSSATVPAGFPASSAVGVGKHHVCSVSDAGELWCWGQASEDQLGNGSTTYQASAVRVGTGTDWHTVASGNTASCGLRGTGTLWCWGSLLFGYTDQQQWATPTQVDTATDYTQLSMHEDTVCGLRSDRSMWCLGHNQFGALGVGDTTDRAAMTRVGTDTDWSGVSTSGSATCATKTTGTIWCWGYNPATTLVTTTPPGVNYLVPHQVGTGTTWTSIVTGDWEQCATRTDKTLWCWGFGPSLGTPPTRAGLADVFEVAPTQVATGTTWSQVTISANNYGGGAVCGSQTDGSVWCWGYDYQNQLAVDTTTAPYYSGPARVTGQSNLHGLSLHNLRACGLSAADAVVCWGGERDQIVTGG